MAAAYDGGTDYAGGLPSTDPYAFLVDPSYAPAPLSPRWFAGTSGPLDADQEARAFGELTADPLFRRIVATPAPFGNLSLKDGEIQQYAFNDPRSPLYSLNARPQERYIGAYRVATSGGQPTGLEWVTIGPQHWYTDPAYVGPILVASAATAGAAGWLPGLYGAPAAAAGGGAGAAVGGVVAGPVVGGVVATTGGGILGTIAATSAAAAAAVNAARGIANSLGHNPDQAATLVSTAGPSAAGPAQPLLMLAIVAAAAALLLRK